MQLRAREICVCGRLLGLGLGKLGLRAAPTSLEYLDLALGTCLGRHRGVESGLLGLQVGGRLLGTLHGAGPRPHELLVTRVFLLREFQRRLGLLDLLGDLLALRLLGLHLGRETLDIGVRLFDLGGGLVYRSLVIPVVDLRQQVTSLNDLIVVDRHCNDVAAHFRTDGNRTRVDERIVRALVVPRMKPIKDAEHDGSNENFGRDADRVRMLAQSPLDAPAAFCGLILVVFAAPAGSAFVGALLSWGSGLRRGRGPQVYDVTLLVLRVGPFTASRPGVLGAGRGTCRRTIEHDVCSAEKLSDANLAPASSVQTGTILRDGKASRPACVPATREPGTKASNAAQNC